MSLPSFLTEEMLDGILSPPAEPETEFVAEAADLGWSLMTRFHTLVFAEARGRAEREGRTVVTEEDVASAVPAASRKIADEYRISEETRPGSAVAA